MSDDYFQHSLFEEDYLLRELGQVAHVPQIALTELVANAWDAGASSVDTANLRLLKLRERLSDRYDEIPSDRLLERVFSLPKQQDLPLAAQW